MKPRPLSRRISPASFAVRWFVTPPASTTASSIPGIPRLSSVTSSSPAIGVVRDPGPIVGEAARESSTTGDLLLVDDRPICAACLG